MSRIRLLHTSDFHFGFFDGVGSKDDAETAAKKAVAGQVLYAELSKHIFDILTLPEEQAPDYWILTGDFSHQNCPQGFDAFKNWFIAIMASSKFPPDRVVMVPGNHDVSLLPGGNTPTVVDEYRRIREERDLLGPQTQWHPNANAYDRYIDMLTCVGAPHANPHLNWILNRGRNLPGTQLGIAAINSAQLNAIGVEDPPQSTKHTDVHNMGGLWLHPRLGTNRIPTKTDQEVRVLAMHHPKFWINWRDRYKVLGSSGTYSQLASSADLVLCGHNHPDFGFSSLKHHFPLCAIVNFGGALHHRIPDLDAGQKGNAGDPMEDKDDTNQQPDDIVKDLGKDEVKETKAKEAERKTGSGTKEESRGFNHIPPEAYMDVLEIDPGRSVSKVSYKFLATMDTNGNYFPIDVVNKPVTVPFIHPSDFLTKSSAWIKFSEAEGNAYSQLECILNRLQPLVSIREWIESCLQTKEALRRLPPDLSAHFWKRDDTDTQLPVQQLFRYYSVKGEKLILWELVDINKFEDEEWLSVRVNGGLKGDPGWRIPLQEQIEAKGSELAGKLGCKEVTARVCFYDWFNAAITPEALHGIPDFHRLQYIAERICRFKDILAPSFGSSHLSCRDDEVSGNKIMFLTRLELMQILQGNCAFDREKILPAIDELLNFCKEHGLLVDKK